MPMTPFMERFPEVGARETRSATVTQRQDLPDGEYGFLELYCDEPGCDCRRATICSRDCKAAHWANLISCCTWAPAHPRPRPTPVFLSATITNSPGTSPPGRSAKKRVLSMRRPPQLMATARPAWTTTIGNSANYVR